MKFLLFAAALTAAASAAAAGIEIRSPGFVPATVAADGAIVEPWGTVAVRLVAPEGAATEQRAQESPFPAAVTTSKAGAVVLSQTAYRAPIWPDGVDVLEATLANTAEQPADVQVELAVPEDMAVGERVGTLKGRPVIVLPGGLYAAREEREWGCAGGVGALRGWAKPDRECDPAFRNISAGFGGVPIVYRFAVPPGARRLVALGFCESHHDEAGERVLSISVEGAPAEAVDPIKRWGRHVPGVVRAAARDADGNGRLEITVAPHASTGDRNPILNAIWIFDPEAAIEDAALIVGRENDAAERYVDVGGERDQPLFPPGNVRYRFALQPRKELQLLLLVRSPDCQSLPDPAVTAWTAASLRKAAADVWRDRWDEAEAPGP